MKRIASSFFALAVLASASTITFQTPTGSMTSGPVNDTGQVSISGNTITVTLTDLQANPTDVAQLLSDFSFTLNSTFSGLPGSVTPSATLVDINSASIDVVELWNLSNSGNTITLERLGAPNAPDELVIGPGPYTNANGSIDSNKPHNPFIDQVATFTFTVSGLSSDARATAASFSFGTTLGQYSVDGCTTATCGSTQSTTPEPMTAELIGAGLIVLGALMRRWRAS